MKKIILPLISVVFLFSCGTNESSEKGNSNNRDTTSKDTVIVELIDSSILEIKEKKRLQNHSGSWIDENLNNPVFFSKKVDSLVSISKADENLDIDGPDYSIDYLNKRQITSLNTNELIYYCLAYPSSFTQICDGDQYYDTTEIVKIKNYLPADYSGEEMTTLQLESLIARKKEVLNDLINYFSEYPDKVHNDLLNWIVKLDAIEMIPSLIETASLNNVNNYTALLLLMNKGNYLNKTNLSFYDDMYGDESYLLGHRVEATSKNRKEICSLASKFYKERKKINE